jgi:hypothetical protein
VPFCPPHNPPPAPSPARARLAGRRNSLPRPRRSAASIRLSTPGDLTRATAPAQQSTAAALAAAAGASPSPAPASPAAPETVFRPPRPRAAGVVDSVSSAPSTASPVSAPLSFPPWNFPCHHLMHVPADSVLTMTLGSTPFDFFLACGTFSCRSLLLKVDLHQIWDQNWGLWKTQLVMTCENNSEPVKQRGIKHLWKGIRLLPLLTSYVSLGKDQRLRC